MDKLINSIINKEYDTAISSLKEELASIVERKLYEKKKMLTAEGTIGKKESDEVKKGESIFKQGPVKAQRKSLRKATKIVKEATLDKDGLVSLPTGERVLRSVYNARRWLSEASGGKAHFFDQWETVKEKLPKGHKGHKHLDMAQKAAEDDDMEKAVEHLEHAAKMARELKEEMSDDVADIASGVIDRLSKGAKAAVPEKSDEIDQVANKARKKAPEIIGKAKEALSKAKEVVDMKESSKTDDKHFEKQDKKKQDTLNALLRQGKSYAEAKKKIKLKEDCGLDPDKEKKVEAAREMARMLLQPQLDTTAPRVDRTKVGIPKAMRPADRLTAPDLGPKEDEWMHGEKLDEARKMSGWFADGKEDLEGNPHPTVRKHYLMALAQHKKGNVEGAHKHMKAALDANMRRKQKVSDEPGMEQGNMDEEQINEAAKNKDFRLVADLIKNVPNEKKRKILAQHHADIFTSQNPRFDKKKFLTASGVKEDDKQLDEVSDELKAKYKEKAKGNLDLAKFTKKELFGPQTKIFDKKHKFNKQLANIIKKRKKGLKLASKLDEDFLDEERKRTRKVADAFLNHKSANERTLKTDGKNVTYNHNIIAKHEGDEVHVTTAGWGHSPSTRGHINGILRRLGSPQLRQHKGQLMHGDTPVGSKDWIKVKKK